MLWFAFLVIVCFKNIYIYIYLFIYLFWFKRPFGEKVFLLFWAS